MDELFIHFLVEDASGAALIKEIMAIYNHTHNSSIKYELKCYKGIGTIPKNSHNKNQPKTDKLLSDLPQKLRGLTKSLAALSSKAAIIIVLDLDRANCIQLKQSILNLKPENCPIEVFCCIAIEEMEAWLLGDSQAILSAYPQANKRILSGYKPDSIIGTWEKLADTVYPGGIKKFLKAAPTWMEQGKHKSCWAKTIGQRLDLFNNQSPSFKYFLSKIDQLRAV